MQIRANQASCSHSGTFEAWLLTLNSCHVCSTPVGLLLGLPRSLQSQTRRWRVYFRLLCFLLWRRAPPPGLGLAPPPLTAWRAG